jgi:hypothetical protein
LPECYPEYFCLNCRELPATSTPTRVLWTYITGQKLAEFRLWPDSPYIDSGNKVVSSLPVADLDGEYDD